VNILRDFGLVAGVGAYGLPCDSRNGRGWRGPEKSGCGAGV